MEPVRPNQILTSIRLVLASKDCSIRVFNHGQQLNSYSHVNCCQVATKLDFFNKQLYLFKYCSFTVL